MIESQKLSQNTKSRAKKKIDKNNEEYDVNGRVSGQILDPRTSQIEYMLYEFFKGAGDKKDYKEQVENTLYEFFTGFPISDI
ncbi:MAG: hypothetical protein BAJALOKI1v1_1960006 [Promethearchaeota archaeon]|nr:MAG: hypothetical protein BAJALOKI1v1_1960006 [Candidatus Lokiarchaeota archaeon]